MVSGGPRWSEAASQPGLRPRHLTGCLAALRCLVTYPSCLATLPCCLGRGALGSAMWPCERAASPVPCVWSGVSARGSATLANGSSPETVIRFHSNHHHHESSQARLDQAHTPPTTPRKTKATSPMTLRLRRGGKEVEKGVGRPHVAGGKSSGGV